MWFLRAVHGCLLFSGNDIVRYVVGQGWQYPARSHAKSSLDMERAALKPPLHHFSLYGYFPDPDKQGTCAHEIISEKSTEIISNVLNDPLRRELASKIIVDHIDTDLLCTLLGVVILGGTKIVDKKRDIVADALVIGLE